MSTQIQDSQKPEADKPEGKSDKEINFRKQEEYFKQQLERKEQEKAQMAQELEKLKKQSQASPSTPYLEDDDDDEPYVDKRRLGKELAKFEVKTGQKTREEIQQAVQSALSEERRNMWLKNNTDFYEVMQHAQKIEDLDPELAETILQMPEGFDRQKLVYKSIKAMGLHKPKEEKKAEIQSKIDQNRRSPYYQPSGVGTAPYGAVGDFTPVGQKNAYQKMQELKSRLGV